MTAEPIYSFMMHWEMYFRKYKNLLEDKGAWNIALEILYS